MVAINRQTEQPIIMQANGLVFEDEDNQEDNFAAENDERIDSRLFTLLLELRDNTDPELEEGIIYDICEFFHLRSHLIDPTYIDEDYENSHGSDAANFFALISELTIDAQYKNSWLEMLTHLLIQDAGYLIEAGHSFDRIWFIDKIIKHSQENECTKAAIRLLTNNLYSFALLKDFNDNFYEPLETLMEENVMHAIRSRFIRINEIFVLRTKLMESNDDLDFANLIIDTILSRNNIAYLTSPEGSTTMLRAVINANWPEIHLLQNALNDPTHFWLLTSSRMENLIRGRIIDLNFAINLDRDELSSIVHAADINEVFTAINHIVASGLLLLSSQTAQQPSSSSSAAVTISAGAQQAMDDLTTVQHANKRARSF